MASCYRSISRPGFNLLKSAFVKPCTRPVFPAQSMRSPSSLFSRSWSQMGALYSLCYHSTRLSPQPGWLLGCRSFSQGMLCSANPGVCVVYGFVYLEGGICLSSMGRPISFERAVAWKVF